jgi:hypothetical protein
LTVKRQDPNCAYAALILKPLGLEDSMGRDDWRSLAKDVERPMVSLGEKLQQALRTKNG